MHSRNKEKLVEGILTMTDNLFRQLLPSVPRELLTLDATMPQMKIMLMLYINEHLRMSEIAAGLEVTMPTATSLVERLVEKQYVLRENQMDDRRVVLCRLTTGGQKAIQGIWDSSRKRIQGLLEDLDFEKLEMTHTVIEAMLDKARSRNNSEKRSAD